MIDYLVKLVSYLWHNRLFWLGLLHVVALAIGLRLGFRDGWKR